MKTTFSQHLAEKGIIFCSIGDAIKNHPDLVKQYLGSVVPYRDNFYAALNSAVFSDGSFVYIPKGVRCPMELSSYFRINAPTRVSLSVLSSLPTTMHTFRISKDAPLRCATRTSCTPLSWRLSQRQRRGEVLNCAELVSG